MSYLTCPYCPSQAYPVNSVGANLTTSHMQIEVVMYRCTSRHTFFVEEEHEKPEPEIPSRCIE